MWGLLSLTLVALTATPPPSVDPFLKDVPGVTASPTSAVSTKVDGILVVQRSLRSDRSPEELKEFFGAAFEKAGFYIAPDQDKLTPQLGVQISGLDTENLLSYTALLQPSGNKGTTIVLAVANLGKKDAPKNPIGPVYPGAVSITMYNLESMKAMTYRTDGTPAEIKTFYRDTLTAAGFKEGEPNTYVKGNQQFAITVSPGVSEREVMVQLATPGTLPAGPPRLPDQLPTKLPPGRLPTPKVP